MSMSRKGLFMLVVGLLICMGVTQSQAAIYEVGAGKTYATIQSAVDVAGAGDEVVVYAGVYTEFVDINRLSQSRDGITVRAYKNPDQITSVADRVVVQGGFVIDYVTNATVQGFYVTTGPVQNLKAYWTGSYYTPVPAVLSHRGYSTSGGKTASWNNMVVYNVYGQEYTDRGVTTVGGYAAFGYTVAYATGNLVNHTTVYNVEQLAEFSTYTQYLIHDSIMAFNDAGWVQGGTYASYTYYSDIYNNPGPDSSYSTYFKKSGTGNIEVDPLFYSTDPSSPYFLWLNTTSPAIGTATNGTNMGALPVVPEPTTMILLGLGACVGCFRRR